MIGGNGIPSTLMDIVSCPDRKKFGYKAYLDVVVPKLPAPSISYFSKRISERGAPGLYGTVGNCQPLQEGNHRQLPERQKVAVCCAQGHQEFGGIESGNSGRRHDYEVGTGRPRGIDCFAIGSRVA